jgi:hypothetical protein
MLVVLGVVVLRGALPCHDADGNPARSIDRLIASTLCTTGYASPSPPDAPLAPDGGSSTATTGCLHCASGQGLAIVVASLGMLAFARRQPAPAPGSGAPEVAARLRRLASGPRGPPPPGLHATQS